MRTQLPEGLVGLLSELLEYMEQREDVVDTEPGEDGPRPAPNEEMRLAERLRRWVP